MRRAVAVVVWALALVGVYLIARSCFGGDTPEGHRADSTLAEAPHWADTVRRQNATIAKLVDSIAGQDTVIRHWKRVAHTRLASADTAQAVVDSTVAAGVPAGVDPAVFWKQAFEAQRRVAASLRTETIPALLATIAADSAGMRLRDAKADTLEAQRDEARRRVARVTNDLAALREATRPGFDVFGVHLPGWVDNAASAALGVGIGYAVH